MNKPVSAAQKLDNLTNSGFFDTKKGPYASAMIEAITQKMYGEAGPDGKPSAKPAKSFEAACNEMSNPLLDSLSPDDLQEVRTAVGLTHFRDMGGDMKLSADEVVESDEFKDSLTPPETVASLGAAYGAGVTGPKLGLV